MKYNSFPNEKMAEAPVDRSFSLLFHITPLDERYARLIR
jgi:hypothetical protein